MNNISAVYVNYKDLLEEFKEEVIANKIECIFSQLEIVKA